MKIRSGFVSNSSSSSFIAGYGVVPEHKMKDFEETMKFFEAKTGKEAIGIVENEDVHLILLDIMMPIMDGITTAAKYASGAMCR